MLKKQKKVDCKQSLFCSKIRWGEKEDSCMYTISRFQMLPSSTQARKYKGRKSVKT